jgi:hypothetical protein
LRCEAAANLVNFDPRIRLGNVRRMSMAHRLNGNECEGAVLKSTQAVDIASYMTLSRIFSAPNSLT